MVATYTILLLQINLDNTENMNCHGQENGWHVATETRPHGLWFW